MVVAFDDLLEMATDEKEGNTSTCRNGFINSVLTPPYITNYDFII
jgi:hypothetical protein